MWQGSHQTARLVHLTTLGKGGMYLIYCLQNIGREPSLDFRRPPQSASQPIQVHSRAICVRHLQRLFKLRPAQVQRVSTQSFLLSAALDTSVAPLKARDVLLIRAARVALSSRDAAPILEHPQRHCFDRALIFTGPLQELPREETCRGIVALR